MTLDKLIKANLPILIGASLMLTLSMGMRQSLGVFMLPLTKETGMSISEFTLAIAVQNLSWGFLQPWVGAWAGKNGYRHLLLAGSVLYVAGLTLLASAHNFWMVLIGAGLFIGLSLSCTGSAMAMAVATRCVSPAMRSTILGTVSAAGSIGALIAAPIGQTLSQQDGWRVGVAGFVVLGICMIPAAWYGAKVDQLPIADHWGLDSKSASFVARHALQHPPFMVMTLAYFVCGMQLVFLTTHLPTYLEICGLDPMLSAKALGTIGGFNALGSLFFGWLGGRTNKLLVLGMIYILRSIGIGFYFYLDPTPSTTLVFAAYIGFLWLGVAPLVTGWLSDAFGLRWQAMLSGIAFMSHQMGSFMGALGGGLIFDALGSYNLAIQVGVLVGLLAGAVQCIFALTWSEGPPMLATPAGHP
jgi:predicted MFS family arabinose efflux permease